MRSVCVAVATALVFAGVAQASKPWELAHNVVHEEHPYGIGHHECPHWYLLGHMKCGTTTLFKHMKNELDFPNWNSRVKSPHAFDHFEAPVLLHDHETPPADGTPSLFRSLDAGLRMKAFCNYTQPPKFVVTLCDPTNRTWSHFKQEERADQEKRHSWFRSPYTRTKLKDRSVAYAFKKCVTKTLPQIRECMKVLTWEQCGRVLYGSTTPGTSNYPDALGNNRPCKGIVYSSMYKQQLEHWYTIFPKEDFLVVYRDDWMDDQVAVLDSISKHFKVPFRDSAYKHVDAEYNGNFHEQFDGIPMGDDTKELLQLFFHENRGWEKYIDLTSPNQKQSHSEMLPGSNYYESMRHLIAEAKDHGGL